MPAPCWLLVAVLAVAVSFLWFTNLDQRKLVKPDEGRYAEISREMSISGDWVTPRLNGIKYFEKPALHYWAGAAAYGLFGKHEWTARLWVALAGLAGVLIAWYFGRRLFGGIEGHYAAVVLGSSLMYFALAHLNLVDMGLTLFLSTALGGILLAQRDGASDAERRGWMLGAWAAMGLAVLTKGLLGLVLPAMTLVLYVVIERDWRLLTRLHIGLGVAVFLLIAAPWYVLVSVRNPEFPWFFFVQEHFLRYATDAGRREGGWWYFVPLLLVGLIPWTIPALHGAVATWRADRSRTGFRPLRFLFIWAASIFVFFSLSRSKLPHYILPMFPALALLAGWQMARMPARRLAWELLPIAGFLVAAAAVTLLSRSHRSTPPELLAAFKPWLVLGLGTLLLGVLAAAWQLRKGRIATGVWAAGLAAMAAYQVSLRGYDELSPYMSSAHIARQIRPHLQPDTPFYSIETYDQTLDFYLDRTVILVEFRDELHFGLLQEPHRWIPTVAEWKQVWRRQPGAFALMDASRYEKLREEGFPMLLIAHDHRRYIVRTP